MKKTITRPKSDKIREMAVQETASFFGKSHDYIRKIVRGDVEQEEIKRYYNKTYSAVQATIEKVNKTA